MTYEIPNMLYFNSDLNQEFTIPCDVMDPKIKLNVHLQVPSSSTQEGGGGSNTPNTPEIVNSIVNMTCGPFAADFASQNPTPLPPTTLATQVMSLDVPSPMIPSNQVSK